METFFWGNQWWKSSDKAAFAKYLARHGVNFNAWARNHPSVAARVFGGAPAGGGGGVGGGATPQSLLDIATQQYEAMTKPEIDALNQQREADRASYDRRMQNTKDMYAALAGMLGSIGPATGQAYKDAASFDAAAGRGFGDTAAARGTAEGDKAAGYLTAAGAPEAAIEGVKAAAGGAGTGDVVYGLTGYIPATQLNREGAAFTAAANQLPAEAVGSGQEQLRSVLQDALNSDQSWSDKLSQITGSRATDIQKILSDIQSQARADRAAQIQEQYLLNSTRRTDATITGVDPVTGLPTYSAQKDAAKIARDAKSKNAATRRAAIKAREDEFASAQKSIFGDAAHYKGTPMTADEQAAWLFAHKGKGTPPRFKGGMGYAQAKKALFDKYSYLLRYATAAGKAALKRRLNLMIDQALAAAGIHPPRQLSPEQQTVRDAWSVVSGPLG